MKEPGIHLIENFHLQEINMDFMGYELEKDDIFTFHHLIIPNCRKGPYELWNGAILCGKTSHPYLHVIEQTDADLFFFLTSEIIDQNIKGYLDYNNLLRIRYLLMCFEEKYIANHTCNIKIKEEYFKRPPVNQILTRTRRLKNK